MGLSISDWTVDRLERFVRSLRFGPAQLPHSLTLKDLEITGDLHLSDQAVKELKKQLGI